ncbi:MAG: HEAT repeat domain-containing protein [Planctomycetes bacterium]|nr:HEAT repeat domain-containing protein [Planctomycetota bacterium]MBI3847886.1 HEAT repeat domain-containing protein [Planctomycetota bacterium]
MARSAMARLGLGATQEALLSLMANDRALRGDVSAVLREIGDDSIARRLLEDLGDVRDADLISVEVDLIVALARSDESMRAIGHLLAPKAPVELACLGAQILERLRDHRGTPFLVAALGAEDPRTRKAVTKALEALADPEAVPELARHYRRMSTSDYDAKCSIGRAIARSIPSLGALRILSDLAADQRPEEGPATLYGFSLLATDPTALDEILAMMRTDSREEVRSTLISSLLVAPKASVDAPLLEFIESEPSPRLRREALIVAGRMASPQMVESFAASFLGSGDADDVAAACAALRNELSCGEPRPEARALLFRVVQNSAVDPAERIRSIRALARHADGETQRVFEAVKASADDASVRSAVAEALNPTAQATR